MTELTLLSGYRGQLAGRGHEICLSQAIPSVCPERAGVFPPIPWPVATPPLPLGGQAPPHVPGWDKETLRRSSHRGSPGPGVCTRGFFLAQKEQQWSGCLRTCLITRPAGAETLCLPLCGPSSFTPSPTVTLGISWLSLQSPPLLLLSCFPTSVQRWGELPPAPLANHPKIIWELSPFSLGSEQQTHP